jgi:hypothetical protein
MKGWLDNYGKEDNYNDSSVSAPEGFQGDGYSNVGRNYSPAWGGQFQMGGSLPGATGHMYARIGAPSNGKYAKHILASAQDGKWLDKWKEDHPSVRSIRNDVMNRKIEEHKGKGKETNIIQKENTKTVTPKEIKKLSGKQQNELAQRQSEEQARKDQVFESMQEAYKSPLMSPGYFTPEGAAIGALQGVTKLGPDLYEGDYKGAAMDALMALPIAIPAAKTLGKVLGSEEGLIGKVSQEVNINRNLNKIKKEGQLQGLNEYEIAKKQMEQVGITSNQRKGYTPAISEFAEKYITPYGYTGYEGQSKFTEILQNIKNGGVDFSKVRPERMDAWKLYLGRPQVNKTFSLADTAPALHPSYKPGSLKNMDIYNIDSKKTQELILPDPDNIVGQKGWKNILDNPITVDREGTIMGGYNKLLSKEGLQYNDIWDLDPSVSFKSLVPNKVSENPLLENFFYKTNQSGVQSPRGVKVPVSKIFGKPFMSHGNLPYTSTEHVNKLRAEVYEKLNMLQKRPSSVGEIRPTNSEVRQMEYLKDLENYPKFKKGGVIKDDMGQWAHPGEITEINSNDITMEGVPYDVLGISDIGDTKLMKPGKNYKFKGKKVTEYPMAKNGLRQEQKGLQNLDQLTNFTNYNTKQPGGWLDEY